MSDMTPRRLGLDPDGQAAVWVFWFDVADLLDGLEPLAPGFVCPECDAAVDLARPRGVLACVAETPNCRSVSDRCGACQARLHFDNTPAEDRAALRWPQVAIGSQGLTRPLGLSAAAAEALETWMRHAATERN